MNKAAVSYIENAEGKILAVFNRRAKGFSMPGGKVEPNEDIFEAQARELKEETGLVTISAEEVYQGPTATVTDESRGRWVHLFRVQAEGNPEEIEEGCPVQWMTREEFLEVSPFAEFYREAFKVVLPIKQDK